MLKSLREYAVPSELVTVVRPRNSFITASTDILITGAGPAGCAVAIGLRRLGYNVTLVHAPRAGECCEGISARTCEGLRSAGLEQALATVAAASPRHVCWNGEANTANTEHLVARRDFDAALLRDAAAAGVRLLAGRVRRVIDADSDGGQRVDIEMEQGSEQLHCRFRVEARGRAAPSAAGEPLRGPGTVSVLQLRQGTPGEPGSFVSSFTDGWAWLARLQSGLAFVQLTLTSDTQRLPKRKQLNTWFDRKLLELGAVTGLDPAATPRGDVIARGSTSIRQAELAGPHCLRVGDAAMAVDPLSGNGIFQSLSCALVAPAVINTLLQQPGDSASALMFYRERVRHTFLRFARMGRDFYRMESRWPEQVFWQQRQQWPDAAPAHSDIAPTLLGIGRRPVVAQDRICERDVALTSDQPLGVWHVAGVELAPLLRDLPEGSAQRELVLQSRLDDTCRANTPAKAALLAWLRRYGLLP